MSTRGGEPIGALPLRAVLEGVFSVFVIYLLSGGTIPLGAASDAASSVYEGSRFQTLLVCLYLISLALTLKRPRAWWRATSSDVALLALLGWTMASVLWSQAPEVTLVRGLALLGTSVFGIYFAARYSLESQLRLLGIGLGLIVLYNAFLALTQPGAMAQGYFTGAYDHKNSLGKMMALATVAFLCMTGERRTRTVAIVGGIISFGMLVISGSATGLVVALTLLGMFPLLRLLRGDIRLVVILGIAGLLALGIGLLLGPKLLAAIAPVLGRDATLTGRTELWPVLIGMVGQRPWLGYGYSAFWSADEGGLGISWQPTQAHNGFLEVALALGVIGLALFVTVSIRGLVRAVRFMRVEGTPASSWPLMYFGFVFLYNMTEATSLGRNSILWVLFVSGLVTVSPSWFRSGSSHPKTARRTRARNQRVLVPSLSLFKSGREQGIP